MNNLCKADAQLPNMFSLDVCCASVLLSVTVLVVCLKYFIFVVVISTNFLCVRQVLRTC